jgi:outer membrane protein assembly factor BamB
MKTARTTIVATLLAAGLATPARPGLAADVPGDWPMFRGDAGRSALGMDGPEGDPVVRWRYDAGAPFTDGVSIVGDLALASSNDGVLHALDATSGSERWRYEPDSLVSGPTVYEDSVYVFADGSDLVSLDLDGEVAWTRPDVGRIPSDPTAGDGAIYFGTSDGDLVAVDAATGDERWRTKVDETAGAVHRPAFADGRIHVGSDGGGFVAVDAADGAILWRFDTGAFATGTAVVAGGIAYVGAVHVPEGRLWALDAATGDERWSVDGPYASPAVADGVAYSGAFDDDMAAYDATTGERLWSSPVKGVIRPIAVAEGVVYVPVDTERRLYALDASTGEERWRMDLDGGIDCCVSVAGGAAYVATMAGSLYAIGGAGDSPVQASPAASADQASLTNPFTVVATIDPAKTGLSGAGSLAFGPDGNLYVAQVSPAAIVVLSPDGTPIRSFGSPGAGPSELDFADKWPAIAVGRDGLVYVTEAGNARVSVFAPDGTFVRHIGSFGDDPGRFLLPIDIVVDDAGGIVVADDMQRTASRFAADGAFGWRLDPHSDADLVGYLHGGGWDDLGRTWLTNDSNGLVLAFAPDGSKVESWSAMDEALGSGLLGPCQVALDAAGNAYVLDCSNRSFAVFDPEHRLLGAWMGRDPLPFGHGYAFGPDGRLYALAGGDRADGGTVDQPDAILVMEVDLPEAE